MRAPADHEIKRNRPLTSDEVTYIIHLINGPVAQLVEH